MIEHEKRRFITRVYHFKSAKNFTCHGLEANQEIPVLISAAAVQLTFGLRKYKLTYFENIVVTSDAYSIPDFNAPVIGHVSPKGIYLPWKHFLDGYRNTEDNVNVAIHEMAHALEYENFLSGAGTDWEFRKDLEKFYAHAGTQFAKVFTGKPGYLRNYAYSNMREFWTVTAEAFSKIHRRLGTICQNYILWFGKCLIKIHYQGIRILSILLLNLNRAF